MNPPNEKRNKQIVELRDKKKLSFSQIGKLVKPEITKQTVHTIYKREKLKFYKKVPFK